MAYQGHPVGLSSFLSPRVLHRLARGESAVSEPALNSNLGLPLSIRNRRTL